MGSNTRRVAVVLALALCVARAAGQPAGPDAAAAPDFVLKSLSGANLRLSEYRGQVVLLNFWASWCGDCRAELESLVRSHELYRDAGLDLLTVSLDRTPAQARAAAEAWNAGVPVLHDAGGEVARLYDVEVLPMTVLIDRDGRIREVIAGYRRAAEPAHLMPVRALLRE